jgi:protein-disulfide isomerase
VVVKQGRDPMLLNIMQNQEQIIAGQQMTADAVLIPALRNLEKRLGKLEAEISMMKTKAAPEVERQGPPPEDLTKVYEIPVGQSYMKGSPEAPITIVEFIDIECPFCARFHNVVLDVLAAYPEQVNYMAKNFPLDFHANARPAAKAALAAGEQGKYYEMLDLLLDNGRNLNPDTYQKLAATLELDMDQFNRDLQSNDERYNQFIDNDIKLGSMIDVRGTPTIYLNGRKTRARDMARFKLEIDAILQAE